MRPWGDLSPQARSRARCGTCGTCDGSMAQASITQALLVKRCHTNAMGPCDLPGNMSSNQKASSATWTEDIQGNMTWCPRQSGQAIFWATCAEYVNMSWATWPDVLGSVARCFERW